MIKLSCKETSRLISEGLDRDLGLADRVAVRLHVSVCTACDRFTRQLGFLRRAARTYPGPDEGSGGKR